MTYNISRRQLLVGSTALFAYAGFRASNTEASEKVKSFELRCAQSAMQILPGDAPVTKVWTYNNQTPFQEFRVKQGDVFECDVLNNLPVPTTVHWHGMRVPNDMDGVPALTQRAIQPGERFKYRFKADDAGTYWFHSHMRGIEQLDRGLAGALIVEETNRPNVDNDITWMLDDWRLNQQGEIIEDFGAIQDVSHAGRIGNISTVNGTFGGTTMLPQGALVRLRLINIANARIFNLFFENTPIEIIAIDAQPVSKTSNQVLIGPGMRTDILLRMPSGPEEIRVIDNYRPDRAYKIHSIHLTEGPVRRTSPSALDLAPNPIPRPNLRKAVRHEIGLTGGMMGTGVMRQMMAEGTISRKFGMQKHPGPWTINGRVPAQSMQTPLIRVEAGVTCILSIINATAWYHPMHLHGYVFEVLSRNGRRDGTLCDTVMLAPKERVDVAFYADNPGKWMFHCHILEHQIGGMTGYIEVSA